MLLFALGCLPTEKNPHDTDTGEVSEQLPACPGWMGLALGTDHLYSYTPEYEQTAGGTSTYTFTVTGHEAWDEGGTLVTVEGTSTLTASHISEYEGSSTTTYGCNDEGAFLLSTYNESSYVSSGMPVDTWYEWVWQDYKVMSQSPEEGWYTTWYGTRTDANGSFDDEGDFEVTSLGTEERTTPAGTFTVLGLDFNGRVHYYSDPEGLIESPSHWLVQ